MEIVKAILRKGEWLLDALKRIGHSMIPSNVILSKTLTGLGATHSEIHSKRNSIIIEPNVPVILGKLNDNDNLEAVYQKCEPHTIKKYLQMDIPYKKIMTTPESFKKIRKAAEELRINIYEDYFCLFDECEKLTQDSDYRPAIAQPIYDFFMFKNKAFVSATPLEMSHPMFKQQGFQKIIIAPNYDYKKDIELIVTNSYYKRLSIVLDNLRDSKCVCIFYNVTNGILDIIERLNITQYKIYCSEESVKKLKNRGISEAYSQIEYPLAKYNFFTCRFYSALDIRISKYKPDIIMLTDLHTALWTMIDPFTEAIQIQGRFRKRGDDDVTYNSLTHITNVNPEIPVLSREEVNRMVEQSAANYNMLKECRDTQANNLKRKAISDDMKNMRYQDLIDEREEINYFAIDNLHNEQRVRSYYTSGEALYQAYLSTGFFNVTYTNVTECVGEDDVDNVLGEKTEIGQRRKLVELLARIDDWFNDGKITHAEKMLAREQLSTTPQGEFTISAYDKIGKDAIVSAEFKRSLIIRKVNEYDKAIANKQRFFPEVLEAIHAEFPMGEYIPKEEIRQRLKLILQENGVQYKVTQDTIKDYYDVTVSNSREKPSFSLNSFKFE